MVFKIQRDGISLKIVVIIILLGFFTFGCVYNVKKDNTRERKKIAVVIDSSEDSWLNSVSKVAILIPAVSEDKYSDFAESLNKAIIKGFVKNGIFNIIYGDKVQDTLKELNIEYYHPPKSMDLYKLRSVLMTDAVLTFEISEFSREITGRSEMEVNFHIYSCNVRNAAWHYSSKEDPDNADIDIIVNGIIQSIKNSRGEITESK